MIKRALFIFMAVVMFCGTTVTTWAKDRFALVIGNSNYTSTAPLANPIRDANAFAGLIVLFVTLLSSYKLWSLF